MRYNHNMSSPPPPAPATTPRRLAWEVWLVMGLSLGRSGVNAVIALIDAYTRGPIGDQTATLNPSLSARPAFDLVYQLLSILFALLPVLLALYLISADRPRLCRHLGLDARPPPGARARRGHRHPRARALPRRPGRGGEPGGVHLRARRPLVDDPHAHPRRREERDRGGGARCGLPHRTPPATAVGSGRDRRHLRRD